MTDTIAPQRPSGHIPTGLVREGIVHIAMMIVVVALGLACYRSLGLAQIPSLAVALVTYWALLLLHALMRRRQEALGLASDVDSLASENAYLRRVLARAPPAMPPRGGQQYGQAPYGPPAGHTLRGAPPPATPAHPQGAGTLPEGPKADDVSPSPIARSNSAPAPSREFPSVDPVVTTEPIGVALRQPARAEPARVDVTDSQPAAPITTASTNTSVIKGSAQPAIDPATLDPREREIALMQSLIKELADQIKTSEPGAISTGVGAQSDDLVVADYSAPTPAAAAPPSPTGSTHGDYGRLAAIAAALDADRLDLYLDPILGLDDRKAHHFEVSLMLRAEDGRLIDPTEATDLMAATGLTARIETSKLSRTVRLASVLAARGANAALFSSISEESLRDESFRLSTLGTLAAQPAGRARIVVAITQSEVRTFGPAHWEALATLTRRGLHFALVDVVDLDLDFEALKGRGFDFVRLDAAVFLDGLPAPHGFVPASDLCRHLSALGFIMIVGRISDAQVAEKVRASGAALGQGALFGGRRPVRLED